MEIDLTERQKRAQAAFRAFVDAEIVPIADRNDQEEYTSPESIRAIAEQGYPGALVPRDWGGVGMDMLTFGLLNEELGRGCSSIRSLLTVHSMVISAFLRWGSQQQKERWLPRLATGEILGAFALSEPNAGSDAQNLETQAIRQGDTYLVTGCKKWITYGQIADLFLLFAQCEGHVATFLLEKDFPGLSLCPLQRMLGVRASMLAEMRLEDCCIPAENVIGGHSLGLASVASSSLDIGRYSVAWGCVGIAQACLEACLSYTSERKQFGASLRDHQLIQQMITDMLVETQAARLLCYHAGSLKEQGDPRTIMETWMAKYFASTAATRIATNAVQIHGAHGCHGSNPVQRYWRDARIMEIIEGSTQIQQMIIAGYGYL